jgi:hypothetical protein
MLADLDNMVRDFMGQLQSATVEGWYRTRPAHYRALIAALESALRERHDRRVADGAERRAEARPGPAPAPDRDLLPAPVALLLRWKLAPALVPASRPRR